MGEQERDEDGRFAGDGGGGDEPAETADPSHAKRHAEAATERAGRASREAKEKGTAAAHREAHQANREAADAASHAVRAFEARDQQGPAVDTLRRNAQVHEKNAAHHQKMHDKLAPAADRMGAWASSRRG